MRHEFLPGPPHAGDPGRAPGAADGAPLSWPTLALIRRLPVAVAEQCIAGGLIAEAARMTAEDARRCALPFERVLVALEREWVTIPEVRQLPVTDGRDLLDQLVGASIRAYHALPTATADTRDGVPPTERSRERSEAVARTLLDVIQSCVPGTRTAGDAEHEARLTRALGGMSADEVMALVQALRQLHAALRAHRWPRVTGRGGTGAPFQPPRR